MSKDRIAEEASLVGSRDVRLRVGVIGLGRLWETRHKPSLARLADRFQVTAVYDQVFRRAEIEASQIGCAACEGLSALVERPDVDVIYLLSRQWFGLHPIRLACETGKPVYCALPLADELDELEDLARLVEQSGIVFMPEFARRCYPATLRLKELLATQLGPPRLVVGHSRLYGFDRYAMPGPTTQIAPAPLVDRSRQLSARLVLFCLPGDAREAARVSVPGAPVAGTPGARIRTTRASSRPSPRARRPTSRTAGYHRASWGEASRFLPAPGFQVFAERGAAWLEMPEKIQWSDAERHQRRATAAGAHRRRRAQRPVSPARAGRSFAGADDPRGTRDRQAGQPSAPNPTGRRRVNRP